jgi:predicted nuclease of predicted toxin-antitoxin system
MNISDKRTEVLELLRQTNDSALIDEVYDILHPEATLENINTRNLPDELRQKLNKALEDYQSGNYITHEEMKQKVQQWLTK